ncbi:MAG TPA: hypothetical protein VH681_12425, partial [Nitrospiraceae bacterium]
MIPRPRLVVVALQSLVANGLLLAQELPPVRTLGALVLPSIGPFNEVRGTRELSDARVIILDRMNRQLYLASLRSGAKAPLGRDGNGPGEYQLPLWMLSLPSDTTAVYDMANPYRFVVYGPDGKPGHSIPIKYPGNSGPPEAVDAKGHLYTAEREVPGLANRMLGKVVRFDRGSGQSDSLATVSFQAFTPLPLSSRPGPAPPFTTHEQWAVGLEGRVVILHVDPYHVTFVYGDQSVVEGPLLPAEQIRVTREHQEEWRAERMKPRPGIYEFNGTTSYFRRPQSDDLEEPRFPAYLPPFLPNALSIAPNGMVWIKRTTPFGAPPTFDVLDRQGRLAMRISLPPRTRLVGFGLGTLYLARLDEKD